MNTKQGKLKLIFSRTQAFYGYLTLFILLILAATIYSQATPGHANAATSKSQAIVTFWLQTLDSCRQAVSGASYQLQGNGLTIVKTSSLSTKALTIDPAAPCPEQRGNCAAVMVGCLSWDLPIPVVGQQTYHITETQAPAGYLPCLALSRCVAGPALVTLIVSARGTIWATTRNTYQSGAVVNLPTSGAPYSGTLANPIVVHNTALNKRGSPPSMGHLHPPLTTRSKPPITTRFRPPIIPPVLPHLPHTGSDPGCTCQLGM